MCSGTKVFYEGAKANASRLNDWGYDYWRAECENATLELDRRKLRVITGTDSKVLPLDEQPVWMNPWLAKLFVDWLEGGDEPADSLRDNIQSSARPFYSPQSKVRKQALRLM